MHPATPAHILALHETLCFREAAYNHAKEVHGKFSAVACNALVAFDAAQDAFDAAYNEFLRTTNFAAAAAAATYTAEDAKADAEEARQRDAEFLKHLKADADGSAETVATLRNELNALRIELKDANNRLDEISRFMQQDNGCHMTLQAHTALTAILYQNSL